MNRDEMMELAERVEKATVADNALNVQVEIALFRPDSEFASVRANAAGTKCIFTRHDGSEVTHWAEDWTQDCCQASTADALKARARAKETPDAE